MNSRSLALKMLIGRLLTRSGDQAWDFAVPIVLLQVIPGNLRIAALYYLIVRIATVIFLPHLAKVIDHVNRLKAARVGIFLQLIGVVLGFVSVLLISSSIEKNFANNFFLTAFTFLTISGIISQLGAIFMEISVANDLVPSSFDGQELASFNSRLRQLDLFTEVVSPVLAGILMLLTYKNWPLFGFALIALWNVISFFPEYGILKSIFKDRPDLKDKPLKIENTTKQTIFVQLKTGWKSFFKEPVAGVVIAYSLLWMSVLSPHGVLLTAFLKDGWQTPEWAIGLFRGAGAIFGLLATVLFPIFVRKKSLNEASYLFLLWQVITLLIGCVFFLNGELFGQIGFLVFILLSRIGLYGFSLGEMQIRQLKISPQVRGEVNGFANALTSLATIGLFAAGVILPSTEDFKYLVFSSVGFVTLALLVFIGWYRKQNKSK